MVDGDGNSYLTGSDGVNVSRSGGTNNNNIGSHGGNDLASILARLSEREQSHLARLVMVHMTQPANKHGMTASYRYPSSLSTLSPSSPLRVLHGQQQQQLDGHRVKRSQAVTDQDEMIWEMLRDWIAQEQRMMAADQPPTELQQDPAAVAAGQKDLAVDYDPFESSGDDKETPFVKTKGKSVGGDGRRVVLTEPDQEADLVVERDDDLVPASQMAIAESLILLPPTPVRQEKKNESAQGQQESQERLKTTTTKTTLAPLRPSITARSDPSVNQTGSDHLLLVRDDMDDDDIGPEFAYDDHVIEIVQLDPLASVTPQPSPLLVVPHHPAPAAPASPSMNKTRSNPVKDVIADIPSHPSSGDQTLETLSSTEETVTIQPENELFVESNAPARAAVDEPSSRLNLSDPGRPSDDWPERIQPLARLANVSHSILPLLPNITNDTLPPDSDEIEASVNGTWPLIVPLVRPPIDSDSLKVLDSLAGNISAELLPQWRDVISYRGPVQSLAPIDQCDCHCPCLAAAATPLTTDPVATTETIPQSTLDPIPFNCPPLDIATTTATSTTSTTSTTTSSTAMPTTTTEATTTTQMIPPILILEGEGRRIC